jgi:Skp family chaperone for outer membrane proteins
MSAPPKPESRSSSPSATTTLPDTSEILKKMDRDLEELKKRFEQLLKKMDEDLEKIRKAIASTSGK